MNNIFDIFDIFDTNILDIILFLSGNDNLISNIGSVYIKKKWDKYTSKCKAIDILERSFIRYYTGHHINMYFYYLTNQNTQISVGNPIVTGTYPPLIVIYKYTGRENYAIRLDTIIPGRRDNWGDKGRNLADVFFIQKCRVFKEIKNKFNNT